MDASDKVQDNARPHILASDLDGTLIPLEGDSQNQADLQTLADKLDQQGVTLVYSTGRHFASAAQAIDQFNLPQPDWLICDVGTSIFRRDEGGQFEAVEPYQHHQDQTIRSLTLQA